MNRSPAINAFARLGFPERPLLEAEDVMASHRERSAEALGRGGDGVDAALEELNEARDLLTNDARRIRHLLELRGFQRARRAAMPEALADAGFRIDPVLKAADELIERHGDGPSRIQSALLAGERIARVEELLGAQADLLRLRGDALAELRELDGRWGEDPTTSGQALGGIADELIYLDRWLAQVNGRLHSLHVLDE